MCSMPFEHGGKPECIFSFLLSFIIILLFRDPAYDYFQRHLLSANKTVSVKLKGKYGEQNG